MAKKVKLDTEDQIFNVFIFKASKWLAIWNVLAFLYVCIVTFSGLDKSLFSSSFGDYLRSDLFYVLVQGNFENPYEYHPEIPSLSVNAYLPGPYLLIELLQIRVIDFHQNSLFVWLYVLSFIIPIILIFYKMIRSTEYKSIFFILLGFVIFSPSIMYIFTTANIQSLITIFLLLGYFFYGQINTKDRVFFFVSTVLIACTKPQYVIVNLYRVLKSKQNLILAISGCSTALVISLFGFWYFGDNFFSNFNYWARSLTQFIDVNPDYIVHNNASIVGNLSAIELWILPSHIDKLFLSTIQSYLLLALFLLTVYCSYLLHRNNTSNWLAIWLIICIPTYLTPVSFTYNLALFLVPIGVLLRSSREKMYFVKLILRNSLNKNIFLLMIFLTFASKPVRIWLVPERADTNLFHTMNAFSMILAMFLAFRIISVNKRLKNF